MRSGGANLVGFVTPAAIVALLGAWAALGAVVVRNGRSSRTVQTPPPSPVRAAPLRLTPLGRRVVLGLAVVVPVVTLVLLNSSSGFVWDDIKNLRQAQVQGLSISYLLEPTSGHFAPGHRLGDWIAQRAFGFEFAPAQAVLLVGFALSLLLFHRILAELFRPGWGSVLLTLAYGVSMVHVGVTQWWSSGLDRVPATVLSFLAILTYIRWYRTRAWPCLAASVAAVGLGLLFYIKPAFVPVYLVLVRLLLLEPERPLRESFVETVREWWVWLLYAGIAGVLAFVYVSRYPTELNQNGGLGVALEYLGILWSRVFVPNLFGLFVPKGDVSAVTAAAAVATHVLLVALVAWSLARRSWAWRAWTFFAVTFLLNALVVGLTRVGTFAAETVAYTTYFNLEGAFLFFIAVAAAFLPRTARQRVPAGAGLPLRRVAVAVGVPAYVVLSVWGGYRLSEPENWIGARSRLILDRTERSLAELRRSGTSAALVDGVFPDDVMPYLLVPYNSTSEVAPLLDPEVSFDPRGRDLFEVQRTGWVRPVTFAPDSGGAATQLVQSRSFGVAHAAQQRLDGDRLCVATSKRPATIGFRPPQALTGEGLALNLEFGARSASVMSLVVDPLPFITEGLAKGRTKFRVVNVQPGQDQQRVFALDAPRLDGALIVLGPHSELCIRTLEVGRLARR